MTDDQIRCLVSDQIMTITLTRPDRQWRMLGAGHPMAAHEVESRLLGTLGSAPDAVEGVQAFLEKRPATFPGRVPADLPDWYPWWAPRPFEPVP
jgi:hypothetical protein